MLSKYDNEVLQSFLGLARRTKMLSREEEQQLGLDLKKGGARKKRASDQLVVSHMRMAINAARRFSFTGLPMEDLIQEGNIGLMQAAEKYDVDTGYRFSTYARWWVFQAIKKFAYENGRDIRIPESTHKKIRKMNTVVKELSKAGRVPSDEEVAAAMGEDLDKVRELAVFALNPVSINTPVGFSSDDERELGDLIADENAVDGEEVAIANDTADVVRDALACLNDRERMVIVGRFDLDGEGKKTLDDLAGPLGVTRERVRQIEVAAKKKMRKASGGKLEGCL